MRTIGEVILPWARMPFLVCLTLVGALLLTAKDGRDFAGFYEVSNVVDLNEEVRVTLTVRVFNYSDSDVIGATITLEDSLLPGKTYGSFLGYIDIRDRESVRVSSDFTVSRREYDLWQEGSTPRLRIEFKGATGNTLARMMELAQMPLGEE